MIVCQMHNFGCQTSVMTNMLEFYIIQWRKEINHETIFMEVSLGKTGFNYERNLPGFLKHELTLRFYLSFHLFKCISSNCYLQSSVNYAEQFTKAF